MRKHSPAPWGVVKHSWKETSVYPGDDSWPVCTAEINADATEDTQTEYEAQVAANAHLIAAAPDLLEACRLHAEWIRKERDGPAYPHGITRDSGEEIWRAWWEEQLFLCGRVEELTQKAIDKAEGRKC